jgi:hypothetical protein
LVSSDKPIAGSNSDLVDRHLDTEYLIFAKNVTFCCQPEELF